MNTDHLTLSGLTARIILTNAHSLLWRKFRGSPLWSMCSQLTGHGSGYSIQICQSASLDPHQTITKSPLKDIDPTTV